MNRLNASLKHEIKLMEKRKLLSFINRIRNNILIFTFGIFQEHSINIFQRIMTINYLEIA